MTIKAMKKGKSCDGDMDMDHMPVKGMPMKGKKPDHQGNFAAATHNAGVDFGKYSPNKRNRGQ